MEKYIINLYMEKIDKDIGEMQNVEYIKDDEFMEQMQPPCMEDGELEDEEVHFLDYEEDDYPSLCNENIDLLEK